ncbi:transporter associated domain-containing protein [Sphingobacterium chungjuense]|uniref:transporter associated domain-containing protein n=1 Tax=Sphingobacterium chungjuense TaxID=2675553 RepID=UPI00140AE283
MVAGLFISITNHIPSTGKKVLWQDFQAEVVDIDGYRIDKLCLKEYSLFSYHRIS